MDHRSIVCGIGHYLPENVVSNGDLPSHLHTSDEWIRSRTGICQRHIANENETTAFMAFKACEEALNDAGLQIDQIDGIIVATTTPDNGFPAVATRVQAMLGMKHGFGFDIQAVCSGFIYALSVADAMIKSKQASRILLIGAESMSRIVDWNDRGTCVLFGDGAAAILIENKITKEENVTIRERGIFSTHLYSDGSGYDLLYVDHKIETPNKKGAVIMHGREIFKNAVHKIGNAVLKALDHNNISVDDVDFLIPHQANLRSIQGVIDLLSLPPEKVITTVQHHANTSAASIPLALYVAWKKEKKIKQGDLILLEAMGGGLTWGSALLRL